MAHPTSLLPGNGLQQQPILNPLAAHPPSSSSSTSSSTSAEGATQVYHPRFSRIYGLRLAGNTAPAAGPSAQATTGAADPTPPSSGSNDEEDLGGNKDPEQQRQNGNGRTRPFSFVITGAPRWNWIHAAVLAICLIAVAASIAAVVLSVKHQHHHDGDGAASGAGVAVSSSASSSGAFPAPTPSTTKEASGVRGGASHSSRGEEGTRTGTRGGAASSPPLPTSMPFEQPAPEASTQDLASVSPPPSWDQTAGGSEDPVPMPVVLTTPAPDTRAADPTSSPPNASPSPENTAAAAPSQSSEPVSSSSPPDPPPPLPTWTTFTLPSTSASIGIDVTITTTPADSTQSIAEPIISPPPAPALGAEIPDLERWHQPGPPFPHRGHDRRMRAWFFARPSRGAESKSHKRGSGTGGGSRDGGNVGEDSGDDDAGVGFERGEMAPPPEMVSRPRNTTTTRIRAGRINGRNEMMSDGPVA